MNDDRFDLASAYLDGAITPAERLRVESDPELVALVEELRRVQAAVREVPPVEPAARERAIQAALAIDRAPAPEPTRVSTPVPTPVVVPLRRSRTARALSYAAALLAVGVLGAVVVSGVRDSGSDDSVADAPASDAPASAELFTDDTDDTDDTGDALTAEQVPEEGRAEMESGDDAGGDTGDGDGDGDVDTMVAPPDADTSDEPAETSAVIDLALLDAAELGELIRDLVDADDQGTAASVADCSEVLDRVVGTTDLFTTYAGTPVIVGISGESGRVVDPADCSVVAEVPLERFDD